MLEEVDLRCAQDPVHVDALYVFGYSQSVIRPEEGARIYQRLADEMIEKIER